MGPAERRICLHFHFKHMTIKKEPIFFSLVQMFYWASNCVLYSFIVLYLKNQGFSNIICGMAATLLTVLSLVIQPAMGYITDTFISSKKLLYLSFCIAIPLTYLIPKSVSHEYFILVAITLQSLFGNYQYAIIDSWIIRLKKYKPYIDFGKVRSIGSLSYGSTALIFGFMITRFGFNIMFICHVVLLMLCMICMLPIDDVPCLNKKGAAADGENATGAKQLSPLQVAGILMKNKPYVIFLISVAFYQFAIRPSISYLPLIITEAGGNSSNYGLAVFLCSMTEAPVMFMVSYLISKGHRMPTIYTFAMAIGVIRLVLMSLPLGLYPLILGQLLSAVACGTYIRVFTEYIGQITPHEITSSATTLGTALTFGIGGVFGNFSGGYLINWFGSAAYIRICAIAMAVSVLVFLPTAIKAGKERLAS